MDKQQSLEQLIQQSQDGCQTAFSQLVDMYSGRCYGFFYRLCGDATLSHDLLSDLFIKLYEKISTYKGGSFERWLFTIASNIFHDHLRFQYRQKKLIDGKVKEINKETPRTRAEQQMIDKVHIMIGKLDDDTAELILMRFFGQLSFKELSEIRSEPIGTTLSKVHRGLKKLRELMGDISEL